MKKLLLIILFIFATLCDKAQDTIYLKSSEKVIAFIKENLQTEVHYTKTGLPHATMYIVNKNDIQKIAYYNAITENINRDIITYQDTKGRYYHLSVLIEKNQDQNKKLLLYSAAKSIATLNYAQNSTRTAAVCFGAFGIVSLFASNVIDPGTNAHKWPIAFATLCAITSASSIIFHIRLVKKRDKFVDYYNQ